MVEFAGLSCGHTHHFETASSDDSDRPVATNSKTDLRRARQRSRAVVRNIATAIIDFLDEKYIWFDGSKLSHQDARYWNQALTAIATRHFRNDLLLWLSDRRKTTMRRAARAAFEAMKRAFIEPVPEDEFAGTPTLTPLDDDMVDELNQIDAGLLYRKDDSLAVEVGNRVTRALRVGFAQQESMEGLADRVRYVLTEGSAEGRKESGVSGMTVSSKAELIAHDSIQNSYITAATRRYLQNGFRYGVYDATIDFKTSDLCRRMNEHVIDMLENPLLIAPNHPYCRSGIRPILDLDGEEPLRPDEIANDYMGTIMSSASHRPWPYDTEELYRPTTLTEEYTPAE